MSHTMGIKGLHTLRFLVGSSPVESVHQGKGLDNSPKHCSSLSNYNRPVGSDKNVTRVQISVASSAINILYLSQFQSPLILLLCSQMFIPSWTSQKSLLYARALNKQIQCTVLKYKRSYSISTCAYSYTRTQTHTHWS